MNRLLITICGRAGSKGFKNKNLKVFCGKPLVYYSLSAAELFIKNHPELTVDIALNTDSEDLAKLVAAKYPEVIYLPRGAELGGDRVPKMAVYQDSLRRMEERTGFIKRDEVVKIQLRELQPQLPFRFLCQRDLCLPAQRTVIGGQTDLVK